MEDSLKDVLNYYENFCNELADFEQSEDSDHKEKPLLERHIELIDVCNSASARKHHPLEIIEEKDSVPTTSDYSPVDRVETEPIKRKRESCSSLFRRSKASRGCQSYTSMLQSSSDSGTVDINDNINELVNSSSSLNTSQDGSINSYNRKFVAMELEECLNTSLSSVTNYEERTFESKPSSTFIESNEEFMYSTKDLLPGPLNLE